MSISGGYILLARRLDESDIMHEPPVVREVWLYILRKVSHKNQTKYKKNCKRGENFFSLADIQKDLSWSVGFRPMRYSKPQLTKAIRRLRERNMIATQKATRGIYISVLNYNFFQDPANYEGNGEKSTKETRRKHEGTHIEQECKNIKNKNSLPENVLTFSQRFYEHLKKAYPEKKIDLSNGKVSKGANTVYQLIEIDGFDLDKDIRPALMWALKDDFWQAQVNSLAELRKKKSGAENHKFYNLYQRFKAESKDQRKVNLEW